ncbi:MAG: mevalonate kinase family protein [Legionella sp.]
MSFNIQIPAKCILSGEHLILERGFSLVTPFREYTLSLSYEPGARQKEYFTLANESNFHQLILQSIVDKACRLLDKDPCKLNGSFNIESTIPPCSGLGFSAALCVAVSEWAIFQKYLTRSSLFDFAIELEHMFHKKSSGVDIAGVMSKKMIQYCSNKEIVEMNPLWNPELYISNSGDMSITGVNVGIIQNLSKNDPIKAKEIYGKMDLSVSLIKTALESDKQDERLQRLADGINTGNECYYDWGIIPPRVNKHIHELKKYALACKVIGAGHVLSLWKTSPPDNLPFKLSRVEIA